MYNIGDIFYDDAEYSARANFCNENGYLIKEIEADENGRRFQICEQPEPTEEEILDELRTRREFECFPIINRGQLWYNTLTTEQLQELDTWYHAFLDITDTYAELKSSGEPFDIEELIPQKPNWLR